jgi:mannose-6-phosphate isomerase-like protein (cupin superfamily)
MLGHVNKISVAEKLATFTEHFSPKVVAELNGQEVKVVKFKGSFVWHHHETADELFFVVRGRLRMDFRDREVWVDPGEMILVPHGVEHRPHADEEVSILLFEPAATLNTGNVVNEQTVTQVERI